MLNPNSNRTLEKVSSMSKEIAGLEPRAMWKQFVDLNAVPRPSKKEQRVIAFLKDFANSLGL